MVAIIAISLHQTIASVVALCKTQQNLWFMNRRRGLDRNRNGSHSSVHRYVDIANGSVHTAHYAAQYIAACGGRAKWKKNEYARARKPIHCRCQNIVAHGSTTKNKMCTRAPRTLCIDNWFDLLADGVGVHCWYTQFIGFIRNCPVLARPCVPHECVCHEVELRQEHQIENQIRRMKLWRHLCCLQQTGEHSTESKCSHEHKHLRSRSRWDTMSN